MNSPLRNIVVFLNGERGWNVARSIIESGRNVCAIVAPSNSNFWKGECENSLFSNCLFFKSDCVNDEEFLSSMRELDSDLFVVAGFSKIFKSDILDIARYGVINLHAGPLPQYRGGSPLNWQIINDEPTITVSVIQMGVGIDDGDVLGEATFEYRDTDNIHDIHQKANMHFIQVTNDILNKIEKGSLKPRAQNDEDALYWMQRTASEGRINWDTMSARQVFNLVRALAPPFPVAFTFCNGDRVNIIKVIEIDKVIKGTSGRVAYIEGDGPYIICSDRAILVKESSVYIKNGALLS